MVPFSWQEQENAIPDQNLASEGLCCTFPNPGRVLITPYLVLGNSRCKDLRMEKSLGRMTFCIYIID
jgi:hypothetical protein